MAIRIARPACLGEGRAAGNGAIPARIRGFARSLQVQCERSQAARRSSSKSGMQPLGWLGDQCGLQFTSQARRQSVASRVPSAALPLGVCFLCSKGHHFVPSLVRGCYLRTRLERFLLPGDSCMIEMLHFDRLAVPYFARRHPPFLPRVTGCCGTDRLCMTLCGRGTSFEYLLGLSCIAVAFVTPIIFVAAGLSVSGTPLAIWAFSMLLLCTLLVPTYLHIVSMRIVIEVDASARVVVRRQSRFRHEEAVCIDPCFHICPIRWGRRYRGFALVLTEGCALQCFIGITQDGDQLLRIMAEICEHGPNTRVLFEESELRVRLVS